MQRQNVKAIVTRAAGAATLFAGMPVLGPVARAAAGRVFDIVVKSRQARVDALIAYAAGPEDDASFVARLEDAYINEEVDVIAGFEQAARTAVEAHDPAVLPSIGLLLRRIVTPSLTPVPHWKARRCLRLLEELSAVEFGDLRTFVHAVVKAPELLDDPDRKGIPVRIGAECAGGYAIHTALVMSSDHKLVCVLREPHRVFAVLMEHGLVADRDDDGSILVYFEKLALLIDVMPLPGDACRENV